MRESCMYGSERGARGDSRPYRDALFWLHRMSPDVCCVLCAVCMFSDAGNDDLTTR